MTPAPHLFEPAPRLPDVPTRRNAELVLLAFAVVITLSAWTYLEVVLRKQIPADLVVYGVSFAALLVGAHLVVRWFAPYADPLILPVVAVLNGLGLVLLYRIDLRQIEVNDPTNHSGAQLGWMLLSLIVLVVALMAIRDHRMLQRFTYTSMLGGLILLLLPLVPLLGRTINGARIWIKIGPFTAQPAEAAKILLLIFFAGYLVTARDALTLAGRRFLGIDLPRARDLGPIVVAWAVGLVILVLQRDLGTSVLFFGTFVCLLYVATEQRSWIILGAILTVAGGGVAYLIFSHVGTRIDNWIDPFRDPSGGSYQLVQSLFSLANGGLTGVGLGGGRPDLVPYSESDFIVAVLGEELGLTGVMAVLVLYAIFVSRGLRTALAARDAFGKLLATGLSVLFALQLFVTLGGISRLIPSTGLTTPFLSLGGSSLVGNYILVALLLRISDGVRRPAQPAAGFGAAGSAQATVIS